MLTNKIFRINFLLISQVAHQCPRSVVSEHTTEMRAEQLSKIKTSQFLGPSISPRPSILPLNCLLYLLLHNSTYPSTDRMSHRSHTDETWSIASARLGRCVAHLTPLGRFSSIFRRLRSGS